MTTSSLSATPTHSPGRATPLTAPSWPEPGLPLPRRPLTPQHRRCPRARCRRGLLRPSALLRPAGMVRQ
eukprot:709900-Alexandrium_andersonii.AAC.1